MHLCLESLSDLPILDFYKEQKLLHEINGMKEIDQIFEEIRAIMTSLDA